MCGIAGFSAPGRDASRHLERMLSSIAHRGPDGSGTFIDDDIALGHCRLAIVDLTGGAQPRVDWMSGDAFSFNGEIYGFRALADDLRANGIALRDNSDTEILFQLIRRFGLRRAVTMVSGMFAFVFRDGASGAVHLVRDRFGEKPLYYGIAKGQLVFASETAAILCHPAFRNTGPDMAAAYQLLHFEYIPGRASGWTGIEKVPPATILSFDRGQISGDRYWRHEVGADSPRFTETQAIDEVDAALNAAVRKQLVADVPIGVFLSGGLDSSLLTALAARVSPGITALTVSVGGQNFDETPYAVEVANHLGVRHQIVRLANVDLSQAFDNLSERLAEPLGDSSLLPTWLVCRAARQSMTVALGGDGADELFAGYPNFAVQRYARAMRRFPSALGSALERSLAGLPSRGEYMNWPFLVSQLVQGFGQPECRQSYLWMAPFGPRQMATIWARDVLPLDMSSTAFAPLDEAAAEANGRSDLDRLMHQFLVTYLPDDILMKTDRAAMYNSLEVRAPFLDHSFASYVCALPASLKLRGRQRKYVLKQLARRYLPVKIIYRKKHGFAVPIGYLLRTLLRERCCDILSSRQNPVASWFDHAALDRMLDQHMTGQHDHGKRLWSLLVLFMVAGRSRSDSTPAFRVPSSAPVRS
jgi:asparagine synthase (glutamine-hydrolysing)